MNKKQILMILTTTVFSAGMLAGCSNERLENELAYRQIGINSMQAGDYADAEAAFSTALEQHIGKITDTELDICYYKAAAQYAGGNLESALNTYQALIDYNDKDGKSYFLRGSLLLETGDTEDALADYEKAVKYLSDDYELYIQIYQNLSAYNLTEEGTEYLTKAFDIKGNTADHLMYRGQIYYLLGEYENAKTELTAAIEKESVEANLYLAQVYDALGDTESAENYYQVYLASGSADSIVMNALGEIEMGKGNYTAALDYIRQGLAMEQTPNKKELMRNEIIACEYTGDFSGAWSVIQEYVSLYPEEESVQREYIFLKNRQGVQEETTDTEASTESAEDIQEDTQE